MIRPNLFIVGAAKCGTTSLHQYLSNHSNIFMSTPKELNFFSYEEIVNQNLYYKTYLIDNERDYLKLRGVIYICGEKMCDTCGDI